MRQWGRWKKTARTKWLVVTWECQRGFIAAGKWKKDEWQRASTTEFHQRYKKSLLFFPLCICGEQPAFCSDCPRLRCTSPNLIQVFLYLRQQVIKRGSIYSDQSACLLCVVCLHAPRSGAWRHMFLAVHAQLPLGLSLQLCAAEIPSSSNSITSRRDFICSVNFPPSEVMIWDLFCLHASV